MAGIFEAKILYLDNGDIEFDCYLDNVSLDQAIEGLIVLAKNVTEDAKEHGFKNVGISLPSMN